MKHQSLGKWWLAMACLAGLFGLLAGCESDEDTSGGDLDNYFADHPYLTDPRTQPNGIVTLSPASAQVSFIGQTVVFTAVGGKAPYSWDVLTSSGSVGMRADNQGIYTVGSLDPNTVICFDSAGHTAVAQVSAASTNVPGGDLTVSPLTATLGSFGDTVTITATGGTAPYFWAVGNLGLGNINTTSGSSVIYSRTVAGNNTVTLTDSAGRVRVVSIAQP